MKNGGEMVSSKDWEVNGNDLLVAFSLLRVFYIKGFYIKGRVGNYC